MRKQLLQVSLIGLLGVLLAIPVSPARAQIVPDGSVGSATPLEGPNYVIDASLGQLKETNLFHSFKTFNLNRGDHALFTGPDTVSNVITRVTGNALSTIDGYLEVAIPGADFYFINPLGVVFGPDARINTQGAFHVTTADYIQLGEKGRFPAELHQDTILTVDPPSRFGFSQPVPKDITLNNANLELVNGQTLSLTAGNISVENSQLKAPGGTVEMVAVGDVNAIVDISGPDFQVLDESGTGLDVDQRNQMGEIFIHVNTLPDGTQDSLPAGSIDIGGETAGHIKIQGGQFILSRTGIGSTVSGHDTGGDISIIMDNVRIDGGQIKTNTTGSAKGGDVGIFCNQLTVENGGGIRSENKENAGSSGQITIEASTSISISGTDDIGEISGIYANNTRSNNDGGDISIDTPQLILENRGAIHALTFGNGKGGDIIINADSIRIQSGGEINTSSTSMGGDEIEGQGGDISIKSRDIWIQGLKTEETDGATNDLPAVDLPETVNAVSLFFNTATPGNTLTGILSNTHTKGAGGKIDIETDTLHLENGGLIVAEARGESKGTGGAINIFTDTLTLESGSNISAESIGTEDAGNISLTVSKNFVCQDASVKTKSENAGGGNISLSSQHFLLNDTGTLTTSVTRGEGDGGNIDLNTNSLVVINSSQIVAKADEGYGGNITIDADAVIKSSDSVINASSNVKGQDGEIRINSPESDISGALLELPDNFIDAGTLLPEICLVKGTKPKSTFQVDTGQHLYQDGGETALANVYGVKGHRYEMLKDYPNALVWTRKAVFESQKTGNDSALFRWQWQSGRILKGAGRLSSALRAYTQAMDTLNGLKVDKKIDTNSQKKIEAGTGGCPEAFSPEAFRQSVIPLYYELADLYLLMSDHVNGNERNHYLSKARDIMEQFKKAEIRDHFKDACIDAHQGRTVAVDKLSASTAVVYYISFPEKLEILVSFPSGIRRYTTPVSSREFYFEVHRFRHLLEKRTTRQYLRPARKLYKWLITPMEMDLLRAGMRTLVFIPDRILRMVPLSALNDGSEFLIQKFAVATTPGLSLTLSKTQTPLKQNMDGMPKVLLAGLTRPVQGFSRLANVESEIRSLKRLLGGRVLVNDAYVRSNLQKEIQTHPYAIVHIATHGLFTGNIDDSFLLALDGKLTIDLLDEYIRSSQYREEPLDLLTLSACQTAAGDDDAALGLAGICLKAGAKSSLATLWAVNDQTTSCLVIDFYTHFMGQDVQKAQALRIAQEKMILNPRYSHPYFWAPFLLIGNWL